MRSSARVIVALVMALGLVTATMGAATAAKANTTVSIKEATGSSAGVTVRGNLTSPKDRCENNRRVAVYHDVGEEGPSGGDFKLGTDRSNDNGKWRVDSPYLPDKVYAVAKRKRGCKTDVSKTEVVEYK